MTKNSLSTSNKILIYKMLLRPIITYAAPVWCNIAKTNLMHLQRFQNKQLRLILNADRYTRIIELHEKTKIETLDVYIKKLSENFYDKQLQNNNLTKNVTNLRRDKLSFALKHKLPYQFLSIFNKPKI